MPNLTEQAQWEAGIYQLETTDPVVGGPNGVDNLPHKLLANRALYLKTKLGLGSLVAGDLLVAQDAETLVRLPAVAAGQVLASQGIGQAPAYTANPAVSSIALGTNPAQSGLVRLANNGAIVGRNALNLADIELLKLDGSDIVQLASGGQAVYVGGNLQRGATTGHYLLQAVQGDATQPTYSFVGDGNTGMYRVSGDVLGFTTAGVHRMQIDASGLTSLIKSGAGVQLPLAVKNNGQAPAAGNGAGLSFYSGLSGISEAETCRISAVGLTAVDDYMAFYTREGNILIERMRIATNGPLVLGSTTYHAGLTGAHIVLSNAGSLYGANGANNGLIAIAKVGSDSNVRIAPGGNAVIYLGTDSSGTGALHGDAVLGEGKALRALYGTNAYILIYGTANQTHLGCNSNRLFIDSAVTTVSAGAISTYWDITLNNTQYRIPLYALA